MGYRTSIEPEPVFALVFSTYAPSLPARADLVDSSGKTGHGFHLFGVWVFFPSLISADAANVPLAALLKIPILSYF